VLGVPHLLNTNTTPIHVIIFNYFYFSKYYRCRYVCVSVCLCLCFISCLYVFTYGKSLSLVWGYCWQIVCLLLFLFDWIVFICMMMSVSNWTSPIWFPQSGICVLWFLFMHNKPKTVRMKYFKIVFIGSLYDYVFVLFILSTNDICSFLFLIRSLQVCLLVLTCMHLIWMKSWRKNMLLDHTRA